MEPKRKFILVVNPISGDLDKTEMIDAVKAYAEKSHVEITVYETSGEKDEELIRELNDEIQPQRILIAGGDGTIKMVAEALESVDVIFGILPAGSANGLSVDLNFPAAIEENLEIAFNNDFMEIDMVCINDKKSLHLSDIGLNAGLIKNYENSTIRGKIGYALQSITTLQEEAGPFEAKIEVNGETITTQARMIVIANSQKYGTGVIINPIGKMNDGKFEIVILRTLDLVLFSKIITGNMPLETGEIEIISATTAKILLNVPVHFQIDGEYYGEETELEIRMLPRQMKVAIPLSAAN
jgi:YegS/Rv2252/BmrU family lipid kinase